jgi:hypothetical protein
VPLRGHQRLLPFNPSGLAIFHLNKGSKLISLLEALSILQLWHWPWPIPKLPLCSDLSCSLPSCAVWLRILPLLPVLYSSFYAILVCEVAYL